jgi:hypothetical protein
MWSLVLSVALSATPDLVLQRVDETAALRARLLEKGKPSISRDAYAKAAAGDVITGVVSVDGSPNKKAWGVAVLDVPIDRLWGAINDDSKKVEHTQLDYLEILEGRVCEAPRRVFQFLPVPLLTDRWWIVNVRYNDALARDTGGRVREQHWATDGRNDLPTSGTQAWGAKGIPVGFTRGSWFLVDLDGKSTLVEYYTWADPGGSVPTSIANSFADDGIEGTLQTMEKLARSGTTCTR